MPYGNEDASNRYKIIIPPGPIYLNGDQCPNCGQNSLVAATMTVGLTSQIKSVTIYCQICEWDFPLIDMKPGDVAAVLEEERGQKKTKPSPKAPKWRSP